MADPRLASPLDGIAPVFATFTIDNSTITYDATKANGAATTMIGMAVTFSTDRTVALTADGDAVLGKLISVNSDNKCVVQIGGAMTLPSGAGATLTIGLKVVGDLDSSTKGYIREAASGTAAELNKGRGIIMDNDDTAAVIIYF